MQLKQILKDWGLETLILSLFVAVMLPYGAGITFDSISFLEAGESFWSEGKYTHIGADGQQEFAAHRFPLYPLILQLVAVSSKAILAFQVLLFTTTLLLFRFFLKEIGAPKYFLILFATFPVILCYYCVWTEGLYGLLFVLLLLQLQREADFQPIILLSAIVVLLCLTKMVGLVVAASLLIAFVIDKRPLRGASLFGIGLAIIIAWTLLGSYFLGETAREVSSHWVNANDIFLFVVELGRWLTPASWVWIPFVSGLCLLVFPVVLFLRVWKRREDMGVLFWFLIIHFYAYCLFLLAAKSLIDSSVAWGARTNFPLILNLIGLLVVIQSGMALSDRSKEKIRYVFPKVAILVVVLHGSFLLDLMLSGVGYNSKDWRSFEFTSELPTHTADVVFTNDQAALKYYAEEIQSPILLPEKMDLYSRVENEAYEAEMDVMLAQMGETSSNRIIWIRNGITGEIYPSYEELQQHPNLEILYDDWLCLILKLKD